jgi:hypothetical protein
MKKIILLLLLAFVGQVANLVALPWLIASAFVAPNGTRAWKILVAYDMLGNAATGGDVGETISARAYKASLVGNKYGCWLCKFLDYLKPNHCEDSIK